MLPLLFPDPRLCLDRVEITPQAVNLCLQATAPTAPCPGCAQLARQVHSHYTRSAHDLPIQGRPTLLKLTARRFFCRIHDCPRRVFCEQFPALLAKHAQATARLHDTRRNIGMALGGQPGARLANKLGMPTSPDTILRRVQQPGLVNATDQTVRVIGVDDWAMRKGHTYGTIIIDLERSVVLELLPGRDGVELKTWLGRHPEVEVLSRDRWSAFAEAATEAAPQARQVADRFHLLKNAREALERFLDRYAGRIAEVFATPARELTAPKPGPATAAEVTPETPDACPPEGPPEEVAQAPIAAQQLTARQQQRLERYHEVHRRHTEGQSLRRIAREMHLSKTTVLRHLRSEHCPDWRPGRTGPSRVDPHRDRIDAWLANGNRNAAQLHRLLQAEDTSLGYDLIRRYLARRLAVRGEQRARAKSVLPPPPPPSSTGLSFAVIARPDERTEVQVTQVAQLREMDSVVGEVVGLVEEFAVLVRQQSSTTLTEWQERARVGSSIELRRFAEGLSRDQEAVQAALKEPWSNGPVEGHINRLKTIKRQMYGRAGLALLRARVLHTG